MHRVDPSGLASGDEHRQFLAAVDGLHESLAARELTSRARCVCVCVCDCNSSCCDTVSCFRRLTANC